MKESRVQWSNSRAVSTSDAWKPAKVFSSKAVLLNKLHRRMCRLDTVPPTAPTLPD